MARSSGLSFYKKRKKINIAIVKEVFSWIFCVFLAVFLAGVITYFFGMTTNVVGVSMEPSLYNGEKIFVDRFIYVISSPRSGDVVIFLPNGNENSHYHTKRVLAVPGDKVWVSEGVLYVNGQESKWTTEKILDAGIADEEFILQNEEYFCMGDNPNNSEDSRSANIGPVRKDNIIGKVWFHLGKEDNGIGFVK
ncbi:MAG: signal peptidase I [Bacteroidales bacterium]|nr:signal peptidase I [Lachnoclostridium sp.]MCM1385401.1 signal peptidase I [Lachnoclostridium sp.]MCM1464117.1 signal peptidase I [Bacteroidales bacterium]